MQFCVIPTQIHDNIVSCFWGIYDLFGGAAYQHTNIMSAQGITILVRILFVSGLIFTALYYIYKTSKSIISRGALDLFDTLLISIFLINMVVLCLCNDMQKSNGLFEYRYHLIGMIPIIILFVKSILTYIENSPRRIRLFTTFVFAALSLHMLISSYRTVLANDSSRNEFHDICEYAQSQNIHTIYFDDYEASEICRLFGENMNSEYICYVPDGTSGYTIVFDYYNSYMYQELRPENALVVIYSTEALETIDFAGYTYSFVSQCGAYEIYQRSQK